MSVDRTYRPPLLAISHFPPPVHGFAVISEAMAQHINTWRPVEKLNFARPSGSPALKHLRQAAAALGICAGLVVRRMRGSREISMGVNGGLGLLYNLMICSVARVLRFRVVLHHHSYGYINRRSRLMGLLCALGGPKLEHVFLADCMAAQFQARYGAGQAAHVLENALFVPAVPPLERKPGPLRIGLLSNLSREKGLYDFLDTAKSLKRAGIEAEMHLAGPAAATDREAIKDAEEANLVRWLGPLYGSKKGAFFKDIDLFLFPTRYAFEAQPTVIYEAMAAGVPVIAFDRGAIREQVQDCLATVQEADNFAQQALGIIRKLGCENLRARVETARRLHADVSQKAAETLRVIYQ